MEKIVETKTCRHCQSQFEITDKDLEFYEKVSPVFQTDESGKPKEENSFIHLDKEGKGDFLKSLIKDIGNGKVKYLIPPPTLCPDCRQQRRLSFRNERKLYKRKCDATGEEIISIYSPDKKYKVYDQNYWWSDNWNALDYGKVFDFSKSFFEQFGELMREVPKISLITMNQENSEYSNFSAWNKNSYLIFTSGKNDKVLYSNRSWNSINLIDCSNIDKCNNSYQLIDCKNCIQSSFLINCIDCFNCYSSNNLIGCNNCTLCDNLINESFCIKNIKYSEKDYISEISKILNIKTFHKGIIQKYINGSSLENCNGDSLFSSSNSYYCFQGHNIKDCKYTCNITNMRTSYDVDNDDNSELVYECVGSESNYMHIFNDICWVNKNLFYSNLCFNSSYLFGCVGLCNKSYCILNKQYTKQEYETLVPKIIEHMMKTGEWGEFFPSSISPFGYNETVAMEYFPISRDKALPYLYKWSDYEPPFPKVDKIISANKLPEDIKDIPDDILNWAIECEITKKPFRIISQELEFYRKHNLPIPKRHPDQRHLDRMALRNPRKLFDRKCDKCGKDIKTTYSPDRKEIVYCEECYN
ncbi:MAG: hypothetical protein PHE25_04735, partial [Candidatus Gracilibacteria bacterium]|nr:hypothetical protein [Candidatus Gracilibacteria bacterium]